MRKSRLVPLVVSSALFMETTDSTVIATALPVIAADLQQDPVALKLALTSYLVSLAVFIPVSGWTADRFGARTVFRVALAVFMLGSLACAAASSLEGFVAARFLQGMGGAMMVPVGRLVLLRAIPKSELVGALAFLTVPALVGPVVGPPLGGFITTYAGWQWIFFINIPIGFLGIALATLYFEDMRMENPPPLDVTGFLLLGIGMALLMLGLATSGRYLLSPAASAICVLTGIGLTVAYLRHARRVPHPLLRFDLLKVPTFRVAVLGGSLFRIGVGAVPFLLPLMLQLGFGLNPLQSGALTFASAAGALFMKTIAARIIRQFGFRRVLLWNGILSALLLGAIGLFEPGTPHLVILGVLLIGGCVRSLEFTALNAITYADIEDRQMGHATSLASVAQQVALSAGVTVGGFALDFTARYHGERALTADDFWPPFLVVTALSAASVLIFRRLARDAGSEVSGHVRRR